MPAFGRTHLSAATPAVTNQWVVSANMKVGAYTVANSGNVPNSVGGRFATITHTTVTGTDTLGTITIVGVDVIGQARTETLTPVADSTVTGTVPWHSVTSITGAGWVISGGNDTIVVGVAAGCVLVTGSGILHAVCVNTTAAGTVVTADATGTIGSLKSSIAEGNYRYDCVFSGYLMVTLGAASDVTVVHSQPTVYIQSAT